MNCIYPRRCPVCHDILGRGRIGVCLECLKTLSFVKELRCKKCSKPMLEESEYCFDCRGKKHYFDEGYSVLVYDKNMQKSMAYFKFYGRREYGKFYAELLIRFAAPNIRRWQPEVILPVPIHRKRRNTRGYNQTEVIGNVLSKRLSVPIQTNLIKRVKNTKAQKELNIEERKKNVKDVFVVHTEIVNYKNVLVIDDIYTTGSTIDEIAKELKKKGVEKVFFVTVCTGRGF